ncbi:MAG: calcium-translocating P-type ATPase, PMCA-type [Clostridiaceae bacterium]|jgi:Ca2+-transporting ATPase|nr:calcium-translocating P-type ATPase, PMCA-type [Clostridiaceae bacterium]
MYEFIQGGVRLIPFNSNPEELLQHLATSAEKGLDFESVQKRLQEFGENRLKEAKKKTNLQRFMDQFKDVMILILLAAAIISFSVAIVEGNASEFLEPILILLIVVLNALMGVIQESKAEKALEALNDLSAPHARVVREGREKVIDAKGLVPGDIILLEAGDFIPADARLLESASLKAEESALTGESLPSEKDAGALVAESATVGDRHNMVFLGCSVTYGRARGVVTATGMNTEMGKIANLLEGAEETKTPLQEKLARLGKSLGIIALAACSVIFAIGSITGMRLMEIFMIAVSLAVSAIPEGLPAIVTIVLSIGVQQMVKKNAIIRRLPAVETLGSASVICSDKTGTLTQNRMTLVKAYAEGMTDPEEINTDNSKEIRRLLLFGMLCSDGVVELNDDEVKHIGDPTETAIVLAAIHNGITRSEYGKKYPRIAEIPFDSNRKAMSVVVRMEDKNIVIVKGAFDMLISKCVTGDVERAGRLNEELSKNALRMIALAYKEIDTVPETPKPEDLESGLIFMGLMGMIDPPRPEAYEAVKLCVNAGIKPVMITGDHVITAAAIAKDIGILQEGDDAVSGSELAEMSDDILDSRVENISVYARVSPEDKIRIVQAWQKKGRVVSMTGDGVNDAPALKAADIGCAMGITGTDVAKGASDMILTDDNFATIVEAVKQGRGIYDNIKKTVGFLLGTNIGELLTVFFAMIIWQKSPLLSMQLLWINLVTDSLPAIALGMEAVEAEVMSRKPKPKDESIFAHGLLARIILQGGMFAALTLIGFRHGELVTGQLAGGRTMAFIILALTQVVHSFNMRSNRSLFHIGPLTNHKLNMAALISAVLVLLVVLIPPISDAFGVTRLPALLYLEAAGLALVPLVAMELAKAMGLIRHHN